MKNTLLKLNHVRAMGQMLVLGLGACCLLSELAHANNASEPAGSDTSIKNEILGDRYQDNTYENALKKHHCDLGIVDLADGDYLNVRMQPGRNASIVDHLYNAEGVAISGYVDLAIGLSQSKNTTSEKWLKISYRGPKYGTEEIEPSFGWVQADYVRCKTSTDLAKGEVLPAVFHHLRDQFTAPLRAATVGVELYKQKLINSRCGFQSGINFLGSLGTPVVASYHGMVDYVGPLWPVSLGAGSKNMAIVIHHGQGLYSVYNHIQNPSIRKGMRVTRGQPIASIGPNGNGSKSKLLFEVLTAAPFTGDWREPFKDACRHYVDPGFYLQQRPMVGN